MAENPPAVASNIPKDITDNNVKTIFTILKVISIITGCCILIVSRFAFVFFTLAMLPSFTAIFIDKRINKCASSTMCAFNIMGVSPYIFSMYHSVDINSEAQAMLTDIYVWFVVYGSAAAGCVMIWIIPPITARIFQVKSDQKIAKIDTDQLNIKDEWGDDVVLRANSIGKQH